MADLIDRQEAIKALCKAGCDSGHCGVSCPEDAVEVVRCGECKHMTEDGRCLEFADDCLRPSASDYCSYGERKDG